MESQICTVESLKKYSNLSENIDPELVSNHLLISQQLYVEPVLGTALYNDIISRFDNNTLTGTSQTLYEDYIIPAIAFSAWYSSGIFIAYKTQRQGIVTTNNPDNTSLTSEEMSLYNTRVESLKNKYLDRLQDYLNLNQTLFPLYRQGDSQEVSKGGGLFLGFKSRVRDENYGWY